MTHLRNNLKALRKSKGVTQDELCRELDYKKTTYSNYETGHSNPGIKELQELSKYFGVTIDDLVNRDIDFEKKLKRTIDTGFTKKKGSSFQPVELPVGKINEPDEEYGIPEASVLMQMLAKKFAAMEQDIEELKKANTGK